MTLIFIYIKDIKSSKKYILNPEPILKSDLDKNFTNIYLTFKASNPNLEISKFDDSCELYQLTSVVNKGWVWNEKVSKKDVLYSISTIPLLNPIQNKKFKHVSTQTQTTTTQTQTATDNTVNAINQIDQTLNQNKDKKFLSINQSHKTSSILNYGYANNFLFPELKKSLQDVLVDELKDKFTQPNYGLHSNQNYFY